MRELTLNETRVIGSLIEKKLTTPDQYPLSLNALTNACNQKSNREPVLNLDESEVQSTLDTLISLNLVGEVVFGTRVTKYQHRFCNTEFSPLRLSSAEVAIICCLFLRGPQTPGELRTRTARLHNFQDVQAVESVLQDLMEREDEPLIIKLDREPGRRESRFMHLFSGKTEVRSKGASANIRSNVDKFDNAGLESAQYNGISGSQFSPQSTAVDNKRVEVLEQQVHAMRTELESLKEQLEELRGSLL